MGLGSQGQKKRKRRDEIRWGHSLAMTGILIVLILAASFGAMRYINQMEEDRCFERLYEEANALAGDIEMYAGNDEEQLELLAGVIARYDDFSSPELWSILDSYTNIGMMSRVELLLPGDLVLTRGGTPIDAGGQLSFEEEAAKGAHITDRETDVLDEDTYVVRHYVPIEQNGQITAMLCGVILFSELPEEVRLNPYSGRGALYVIDGNTGDFLIDTWHPGETGNIWALGGREMAPGYNDDQLRQGVASGDSNYVVFVSRTVGEYLYFYYAPMGINDWRIAVSVPESVVFESANVIARLLNVLIAFELVCFILYFLWMLRDVRRVTSEKQRQLDAIQHINDIEQLLFNAHEKRENVCAAIERLGDILSAEGIGFWTLGMGPENRRYFWETGKAAEECQVEGEQAGSLLEFFSDGGELYEAHETSEIRALFPSGELSGSGRMTAVPVKDIDGRICGILAVCNTKNDSTQTALLKAMTFSFGMFVNNLKNRTVLQEQGDRDALTGLHNRNRYERDLPEIQERHRDALTCVYIDVNGLRETNNIKGHDQGDQMLRTVADEIQTHFDTEYMYRIGGDEFILFLPGASEAEITARSESLSRALLREDYHISVGIQCETDVSSLARLIKRAEQKMYAEKKKYYEQHDRRGKQYAPDRETLLPY